MRRFKERVALIKIVITTTTLLIILSSLFTTSCYKEPIEEKGREMVVEFKGLPLTKDGEEKEQFKSLNLLIFNNSGEIESSFHSSTLLEQTTIRVRAGRKTFIALVNFPSTQLEEIETLQQLKELALTTPFGEEGALIYSAIEESLALPLATPLLLKVKAIATKFTFTFNRELLNPDVEIEINKISIKNCPTLYYLLPQTEWSCNTFNAVGAELTTPPFEPLSHATATPLYIAENLQGVIGENSDPEEKYPPERVEQCSYIEIEANYQSAKESGVVLYRNYPGNNSYNDYTIERGVHYRESIHFQGSTVEEHSWRRDISDLSLNSYQITTSAEPSQWGVTSGGGSYFYGESPQLEASPINAFYQFFGWDREIVPVTESAHYTALFIEVGVVPMEFTLTPKELTLDKGDSFQLSAKLGGNTPGSGVLWWSSSNNNVATVSNSGVVTATGGGECWIVVTLKGTDIKDSLKVEVYHTITITAKGFLTLEHRPDNSSVADYATMWIYITADLEWPKGRLLLQHYYDQIEVNASYSFIINGGTFNKTCQAPLTVSSRHNNVNPTIGIHGLAIETFNGPQDESYFFNIFNTLQITVEPGIIEDGYYTFIW